MKADFLGVFCVDPQASVSLSESLIFPSWERCVMGLVKKGALDTGSSNAQRPHHPVKPFKHLEPQFPL